MVGAFDAQRNFISTIPGYPGGRLLFMTNPRLTLVRAVRAAFQIGARAAGCAEKSLLAVLILLGVVAFAPSAALAVATAPVLVPTGGFGIDGDLLASTPTNNMGDWLSNSVSAGTGGFVLFTNGAPVNTNTSFLPSPFPPPEAGKRFAAESPLCYVKNKFR